MLKIAITGAPSTGTHELASALDRALKDAGLDALIAVTDPSASPSGTAGYGLVLLCGLESAEPARQAVDQSLRSALGAAGMAYSVLYGSTPQRVAQALGALHRMHPELRSREPLPQTRSKAWVWVCDKCSDPVCEHLLLSDLLMQRASPPGP